MTRANLTGPKYDFYLMIIDDKAYWLSLAVVGFLLAAVIIAGNSILLFTTYKDPRRSLRTPPSFLITNLSASDLLLGLFNVFLVALRDVYRSRIEHMPYVFVFKAVMYTVLSTTLFVSSYSIIAMSLTCYAAIIKPMEYKSIVTERRIKTFITVLWVLSLATCFLPITNISEKTYTLIYLHTHATLPAISLTVIYASVFRALARRTQELQQVGCDSIASISLRNNRKMAVTFLIILSLFYLSYIPQYITLHLLYFCKPCQHSVVFHKIDVALSRFLFINSALNPFVYAWRLPQYRKRWNDFWQFFLSKLSGIPCKGLFRARIQSSQTKSAWVYQRRRRLWRNRRVDISHISEMPSIELRRV